MYPELFSIGPITVYSYGVLLAISYLLGLQLAMRRAKTWGLEANRVLDLGIYIIIAALIGAKLLLLIVDFDQFRQSPAELLSLARSGGVFYGGLILAVLVAFWYISRHNLPFWTTCDVFAPGIGGGPGLKFPAPRLVFAGGIKETIVVIVGFPDCVQRVGTGCRPRARGTAAIQRRRETTAG